MAAPDFPIIGSATKTGSTTATVAFAAPFNNGGSTITSYTATSNPGQITASSATSPITITGLNPNTQYTFTVTATNADGTSGPSSPSNSITTDATVPAAPTISTATKTGTTTATVAFIPPSSSASTTFTVTNSGSGSYVIGGQNNPSITVVRGRNYVLSINASGHPFWIQTVAGAYSSGNIYSTGVSNNGTQSGDIIWQVPNNAPNTLYYACQYHSSMQGTINVIDPSGPVGDGGLAISSYTATSSPGSVTATGTSSPISFTGLSSGTAYTFTVTATNSLGTSSPSQASNTINTDPINPNTPGAPTIGVATKTGSSTATVAYTAPASNGGYAITSYTAISSPGSIVSTGTTSPITITGLTPGTQYSFVVYATNSQGVGLNSASSNTVTTDAVAPDAPTIGTATKISATTASIAFSEPSSNGGAAVTSYTVTSSPGNITATGNSSPITITGLAPASSYTFTVTATNSAGTSIASQASNQITSSSVVPDAPTIGAATKINATSATVAYTAPASNGGASITSYTVRSTPGNIVSTGNSSPITITGLTAATAYTFTVVATNFVGDSNQSSPSNSITTDATNVYVPGAPTIGVATKTGSSTATVAYTAPASNGGASITGYIGTSTPGNIIASATTSPITFTGLNPATNYTFVIKAVNSVGSGPNSAASNSILTDTAPPGAPTVGIASKTGATTASLTFTPPTVTNGQTITGYTISSVPIGASGAGSASPILITGLTPATAYTFKVRAITSSSQGDESAASNIITTDFGSSANYATLSNQINTIKTKIDSLTNTSLNSEQILYLSKSLIVLSEALGVNDVVNATANAITKIDTAGSATISLVNGTANGVAVSNLTSKYTTLQATYDNINPRVTSLEGVITNQTSNIATASALAASAGYNAWQILTSSKLLVNRDRVFVNTAVGQGGVNGLTLTLPAGPSLGFVIEIVDISGIASTNFFTVARNGEKIQGVDEDLIFNVNNKAMKLIYSNTAKGWRIA